MIAVPQPRSFACRPRPSQPPDGSGPKPQSHSPKPSGHEILFFYAPPCQFEKIVVEHSELCAATSKPTEQPIADSSFTPPPRFDVNPAPRQPSCSGNNAGAAPISPVRNGSSIRKMRRFAQLHHVRSDSQSANSRTLRQKVLLLSVAESEFHGHLSSVASGVPITQSKFVINEYFTTDVRLTPQG